MATGNAPQHPQAGGGLNLFFGLAWGAVMLLVFGYWMLEKYGKAAVGVYVPFFIAALAPASLCLMQRWIVRMTVGSPAARAAALGKHERICSYVFLLGGLGLIVMAFILGVAKKPNGGYGFLLDNFAETVGALLFGLISLAAGYVLQLPREENLTPMQFLVAKVPMLKLSQVVISAACLIAFVYLGFVKRVGFDWFPELAALVFMSMLCVSCFFLLNTPNLDEFGVRLFVLIFGGLSGLILFFESIGRALMWRQDIFLGGITAWQGPNAWHFWLCAYVFFVSLILMAASFNLARADIRTSVTLRRIMYGYDAIVQTLLVVGVLAVLNVVVYAMVPFTYDWTKGRGIYDLSQSTKNLVGGLKKDVNIVVLIPQTSMTYKDTHTLLDNMLGLSNHLKVQYVSPDSDFRKYEDLLTKFKQIIPDPRLGEKGRGILIVNGPMPEKMDHNVPYEFIPERKLTEVDRAGMMREGGRNKMFYKGEAEIVKELKFLLQGREKRKVYFLQGDDEPNLFDERTLASRGADFRTGFKNLGLGIFAEKLRKDNYDVLGLTFHQELPNPKEPSPPNLVYAKPGEGGTKKEIPKDCKTLIVAGVSRPLSSETLEAIERYMEAGGKMMVFLDVIANEDFTKLKDTGMEPMLKRFGVEVTDQFALSAILRDPRVEDARELEAETPVNSTNTIARQFADKYLVLERSARILKPVEPPGQYKAESILELYPVNKTNARPTISVKEVRVLINPQGAMLQLERDERLFSQMVNRTPAVLGLAVTNSNGDKPCLVVFGDADLLTNRQMVPHPQLGKTAEANYLLLTASLDWLAEREPIGAPPRETSSYKIPLRWDDAMTWRMILLPGWLMLLSTLGLGVGIWVARRR